LSSSSTASAPWQTALRGAGYFGAFVALTWLIYRPFLALGFVGWDSYPIILTSKISSLADFTDTFSRALMDGQYATEKFYRPVTNLSFALDYALYGLSAPGFHATDLLLCGACALALFGLGRRLAPTHGKSAGLCAALIYITHPLQLEILPVAPRRADTLCLLFTLGCTLSALSNRSARARTLLVTSCAVLAVGAKETGVLCVPLACVAGCLRGGEARWKGALQGGGAALVAVALVLGARFLVVGGLGGYGTSGLAQLERLPDFAWAYLRRLVSAQPPFEGARADQVFSATSLAVLGLTLGALSWRVRETRPALGLAVIWALAQLLLSALAGSVQEWYALMFVAPFALACASILSAGLARLHTRPRGVSLIAALPLAVVGLQLAVSPLRIDYPSWREVDARTNAQLAQIRSDLEHATAGATLRYRDFKPRLPLPQRGTRGIRSTMILRDYSIEAWSQLELGRRVDASVGRPRGPRAQDRTALVLLVKVQDDGRQ